MLAIRVTTFFILVFGLTSFAIYNSGEDEANGEAPERNNRLHINSDAYSPDPYFERIISSMLRNPNKNITLVRPSTDVRIDARREQQEYEFHFTGRIENPDRGALYVRIFANDTEDYTSEYALSSERLHISGTSFDGEITAMLSPGLYYYCLVHDDDQEKLLAGRIIVE